MAHGNRTNSSGSKSEQRIATVSETDDLRAALEEEQQRTLRLLADFDNFRRRMSRDLQASTDVGRREALLPMLGVLDMLERALATGSSDDAFYQGVDATKRLFVDALEKAGASRVKTIGVTFDPNVHEAVATETTDGVAPGTIVREDRSGWHLGDQPLRPAQVVVSASAEADDQWR